MSKEDVINYVMTTPNNPNRAVLEGMLEGISEGSSSALIVEETVEDDTHTLNVTWQEIYDAFPNVAYVGEIEGGGIIKEPIDFLMVEKLPMGGSYTLEIDGQSYLANSPTDYPSYSNIE